MPKKSKNPELSRFRIIKELLDTEMSYMQHIFTIREIYIFPALKKNIGSEEHRELLGRLPLNPIVESSKNIISDIKPIIDNFNKDNTLQLQIGNILIKHLTDDVISAYSSYGSLYTELIELHRTISNTDNEEILELQSFFQKQQEISLSSLTLKDLLITPVQRIPRYSLLIRDLLNKTKSTHPDYNNLQIDYTTINTINTKINSQIGSSDDLQKLHEFFSKFSTKDRKKMDKFAGLNRKPKGSVIMKNENRKYEIFLLDDVLICTQLSTFSNEYKFIWGTFIPLTIIKKDPNDPCCYHFEIRNSIEDFPFATFTNYTLTCCPEDKQYLDKLLSSTINDLQKNIFFENYDCTLKEVEENIMTINHYKWLKSDKEELFFKKGEVIHEQGSNLDSLYYIQSGIVRVALASDEVSSILYRGQGTIIGEVEFSDYKRGFINPTIATLIAEENCVLVPISFINLISILDLQSSLVTRFYYLLCCLLGCISQQRNYYRHYSIHPSTDGSVIQSPSLGIKHTLEVLQMNVSAIIPETRPRSGTSDGWLNEYKDKLCIERSCDAKHHFSNGRLCICKDEIVFLSYKLLGTIKEYHYPYSDIKDVILVNSNKIEIKTKSDKSLKYKIIQSLHTTAIYSAILVKCSLNKQTKPQKLITKEVDYWIDNREIIMKTNYYKKGDIILQFGSGSQTLYQIKHGKCKAIIYCANGNAIDDRVIGSDAFIGHYAFLFGEYSNKDIYALEDCTILSIHRKDLCKISPKKEPIVCALFALLADNISEHIEFRNKKVKHTMIAAKQPRSHVDFQED